MIGQHTIREGNQFGQHGFPAWKKQCNCRTIFGGTTVTATTGRILMKTKTDGTMLNCTATFHPGPVCDVCDTPWMQENES